MSTDSGTAKLDITFKDAAVALGDFLMPRECIVCGRRLGMREKEGKKPNRFLDTTFWYHSQ